MSSDGAQQGVEAAEALKVILSGENEDDVVHLEPDEFAEKIRHAPGPPWDYEDDGYSACANYLARQILEWLEADPERTLSAVESTYVWPTRSDGSTDYSARPTTPVRGWSDRMKDDGYFPDGMFGCTGFQWGWACNAARKILALPPVANPAIITIGVLDEDET